MKTNMNTTRLGSLTRILAVLLTSTTLAAMAQLPLTPVGDRVADPQETSELELMFRATREASASVAGSSQATAQRRAIHNELLAELETFVWRHSESAWIASAHTYLAGAAQLRC